MALRTPITYSDDVEQLQDGEAEAIAETIDTMRHIMEQAFEQHRHATSGTHAKSHGIATGSLTVHDGLDPAVAQGFFAAPGTYEVVVRFASEPGQIDPDTASRARGLALKVLDVSPARRTYAEDQMAWRPWNGLTAHRPLESINRARKDAYAALGQWRPDQNAVTQHDPVSLADVPD